MIRVLLATTSDDLFLVTIPTLVGACIAAGGSVYAAKVSHSNRHELREVKRKVTTPGRGTLGQKVQAVAELPATDAAGVPIVAPARRVEDAPRRPLADQDLPHG